VALSQRPKIIRRIKKIHSPKIESNTDIYLIECIIENQTTFFSLRSYHSESISQARKTEHSIQNSVAELGLAPKIIYADPNYRYSVNEWIEGKHNSTLSLDDIENAVHGVLEFHKIDADSLDQNTFSYSNALSSYMDLARPRTSVVSEKKFEEALSTVIRYEEIYGAKRGITHHDLNIGNILFRANCNSPKAYFIDWEFAALGITSFDMASLTVEFRLEKTHIAKLTNTSIDELNLAIASYQAICHYYNLAVL